MEIVRFDPAAPGFMIRFLDNQAKVLDSHPLVGWITDEYGDPHPAYWQVGEGVKPARDSRNLWVDVVREVVR